MLKPEFPRGPLNLEAALGLKRGAIGGAESASIRVAKQFRASPRGTPVGGADAKSADGMTNRQTLISKTAGSPDSRLQWRARRLGPVEPSRRQGCGGLDRFPLRCEQPI